jgi:hypothetical protein
VPIFAATARFNLKGADCTRTMFPMRSLCIRARVDMPDDILDDVADDISQDMQDGTVDNIPEDIPDEISDDISDRMSVESEGGKASASVFVDVANEADTSYRASKASKVDNTLDGRCAVQPSVGSPLLINIVASRIPASFFDMGRPGQSFSVQLY